MTDFWISHNSTHQWSDKEEWAAFFEEAQIILNSPLTHLDVSDPVRRRSGSLEQAAEYASQFDEQGGLTWIFGEFGNIGVSFTIQKRMLGKNVDNSLIISTSEGEFDESEGSIEKIQSLFHAGTKHLRPFYSFADDRSYVISRKPKGRSVDITAELVGIFWLTYFGEAYVNFFGGAKFTQFPDREIDEFGGITVRLSPSPRTVSNVLRIQLVAALGAESFVNPESIARKPPGRFALSLEEITGFDNRTHLHD